jgi:hypothetical protein
MLSLLLFLGLALATVLLAFSAAVLGGSRADAMLNTARRSAGNGIKRVGHELRTSALAHGSTRPATQGPLADPMSSAPVVRRTAGGS